MLVLLDDFSMDLVRTLSSARTMARQGAGYADSYVVDSLCCVSRASLMTGQYPHQTGVLTNTAGSLPSGPVGGWRAFVDYGNAQRAVNLRLQEAGYTTGFVGKYLNEYEWSPGRAVPPIPAGWSQFNVLYGSAYDGWGFASTSVGPDGSPVLRDHPTPSRTAPREERDAAYAGSVISDYAADFLREHRDDDAPFFLEVAPYAPHSRTDPQGAWPGEPYFPAAFRDRPGGTRVGGNCGRVACGRLGVGDLPGYGDDRRDNRPASLGGRPRPAWNTLRYPSRRATYETYLRDRARMAQSADRTVKRILRLLGDRVGTDTYVVLTSDNGFHLGQQGLGQGKGTAYRTDVQVPLYVVGPGVVPGTRSEMVSNLDLAPTFEDLAGLQPAPYRSGSSLVPTFADPALVTRDYVFHEHTGNAGTGPRDPDAPPGGELDAIPSYLAVRSRTGLLIRYDLDPRPGRQRAGYEFYSYRRHAWERTNQVGQRRFRPEVRELLGRLRTFDACSTRAVRDQPVPGECRDLTAAR